MRRFVAVAAALVSVAGTASVASVAAAIGPVTAHPTTTGQRPDPVAQIREYDLGDGTVSLHWTNPTTPFDEVVVRYRRGATAPSGRHAGLRAHLAHAKDRSTTLRHLAAGARYSVAIWTVRADGVRSSRRTGEFTTAAHASPDGALTGRVYDTVGDALQHADVYFYSFGTFASYKRTTDQHGRYRIHLPVGTYYVSAYGPSATGGIADRTGYAPRNFSIHVGRRHTARQDAYLPPGGVIRGRVVDAHGAPLAGVVPELLTVPNYAGDESLDAIFSDLSFQDDPTGSDGSFALHGVPHAAFIVCYDTSLEPIVGGSDPGGYATTCQPRSTLVAPGERATVPDQALTAEATGTVAGAVTDASGNPVADADVLLRSVGESGYAGAGTSQSDGHFVVADVPPGRYRLCVRTIPGFTAEPPPSGVVGRCLERSIIVRAGEVTGTDVLLRRGAAAEGVVVGPNGRPVRDATITMQRTKWSMSYVAVTDALGHYVARGVRPGRWRVCVDTTDASVPGRRTGAAPGCMHHHGHIRLSRGRIRTGLDARLGPAGALTISTEDSDGTPLRDSEVDLESDAPDSFVYSQVYTDGRGRVTIPDLATGVYDVCASIEADGGEQHGRCRQLHARIGHVGIRHFTFAPQGSVTVSVRDSSGQPVAGADAVVLGHCTVHTFECAKEPVFSSSRDVAVAASGITNGSGSVQLDGLHQGTYVVCVFGYWATTATDPAPDGYSDKCAGSSMDLSVTKHRQTAVHMKLDDAGLVSGLVTDTDGQPLRAARVVVTGAAATDFVGGLYAFFYPDTDPGAEAMTADDGTFSLRSVQSGEQRVCVDPRHATGGSTAAGYLGACLPAKINVSADTTTGGVHVEVPSAGKITGTVTDDKGKPVHRAAVLFFRGTSELDGYSTSKAGTFHFGHLQPGDYTLCFIARHYRAECYDDVAYSHYRNDPPPSNTTPVPVTAGAVTGIDASLTPKS